MFETLRLLAVRRSAKKSSDTSWYREYFRAAGYAAGVGNDTDAVFAGAVRMGERPREETLNTRSVLAYY